ncbi:hypothetical protein CTI12_AA062790 [Artemisia annua]|uniref:Ulp1 protease family, C-terminal catalytic domain-containing protein n=1 Tax=Artemisia annua TaxID=35608 RepID=A0A2U1Q8I9_ARTAN|nr:hypothetical protein CTI12_AA062790 [Artemisia annua]
MAYQQKQTEIEDALKTVGLFESTTSTKGDPKVKTEEPRIIMKMRKKSVGPKQINAKKRLEKSAKLQREAQNKEAEKRKPQDDEPDEPRVTKKSKNKVDKSGSPSIRTRGANQKKFDEAYKKMKEDRKGKVNEGEPADKEYLEVSEDEEKKTYKRKKVSGKRKVDKAQEAGRATAVKLYETMKSLSTERKKMIMEMGFGDLIDFPIGSIPTKLAFFVVNSLDTDTMTLNLPNGKIPILPETVNEIFGIPMGETMLERQRGEREYDDPFIVQWRDQFPADLKRITTTNLSQVILETTNADYMFKMNFLMLFANTMGCCDNSSVVKYTVLTNVLENDNVQDIDWCSYIWECAKYSKSDWKKAIKDKKEVVYYGPITFLMLMYLHYTRIAGMDVRRKVPACKNCNSIFIKRRENIEVNRKKFGQVEVLGEMSEEVQSNLKEKEESDSLRLKEIKESDKKNQEEAENITDSKSPEKQPKDNEDEQDKSEKKNKDARNDKEDANKR